MNTRWLVVPTLFVGLSAAAADPQATADYRHQVMEALGKHMKASSMIVKGQVERPQAERIAHAQAMVDTSKVMLDLFPAGTGPDKVKTDTKAEAWTDRAGFEKAAKDYETAAAALLAAAQGADIEAYKTAFGGVGKTCGGCHDGYRVDKD